MTRRLTGTLITGNRSGNVNQGLGQGTEMALTVAVFMGIGWFLDKSFETSPIFIISLVVISAVAQFLKLYFVYTHHMRELERERAQRSQGEL